MENLDQRQLLDIKDRCGTKAVLEMRLKSLFLVGLREGLSCNDQPNCATPVGALVWRFTLVENPRFK